MKTKINEYNTHADITTSHTIEKILFLYTFKTTQNLPKRPACAPIVLNTNVRPVEIQRPYLAHRSIKGRTFDTT